MDHIQIKKHNLVAKCLKQLTAKGTEERTSGIIHTIAWFLLKKGFVPKAIIDRRRMSLINSRFYKDQFNSGIYSSNEQDPSTNNLSEMAMTPAQTRRELRHVKIPAVKADQDKQKAELMAYSLCGAKLASELKISESLSFRINNGPPINSPIVKVRHLEAIEIQAIESVASDGERSPLSDVHGKVAINMFDSADQAGTHKPQAVVGMSSESRKVTERRSQISSPSKTASMIFAPRKLTIRVQESDQIGLQIVPNGSQRIKAKEDSKRKDDSRSKQIFDVATQPSEQSQVKKQPQSRPSYTNFLSMSRGSHGQLTNFAKIPPLASERSNSSSSKKFQPRKHSLPRE